MTRRAGWVLVLAALAVVPARAPAADPEPTVLVRLRPLDSILEDAKYLAGLVGQGDAFELADGQLRQLGGVDLKKPLGAYGTLSPGIVDSNFAVLVPVTGEKEFLALFGILGQNPERDSDGVYTLTLPGAPFPAHFRFAHGYAYFTVRDKEALAKDKLLAPAKVFPADQKELLVASVRFDRIPNELRQFAASQIELRLPELLDQKQPGETEAQRKLRVAALKEVAGLATALLQECREIRFDLDLDRKAHSAAVQLRVDGVGKSGLTAGIAALAKAPSPVAGLLAGDAALGGINVQLPESITKALWAVLDEGIRTELDRQPDPAKKALAQKLFKALEPTLKAGKVQSAGALRGPAASGKFTALGGTAVQNAKALEATLRDLLKELPAEAREAIALDHVKAGAVSIHKFTPPPGSLDKEAERLFGSGPMFVAFTSDAVYLAFGENALDALKQALTLKPAPAPLFVLDLGLARLANFAGEGDRPAAVAKKVFQGADKNNDRVRIVLEGGEALKLRMEGKTALFKFLYEVGQAQ